MGCEAAWKVSQEPLGGSLDSGIRRQWWREAGLTSRDGWGRAQMSPAGVESQCGVFTRSVGAQICPDPISLSIERVSWG